MIIYLFKLVEHIEIPKKIKSNYLSKKEWFAILLYINSFVAFAMNNANIYNNNPYNT